MEKVEQEIWNCVEVIKKGGIILYPTDTVWGIGCDATNADAIDKIYHLKKREESKALICLVSNFKMLEQYVEEVPEMAYDILKYAKKPTTVIYDKPIRIADNLVGDDDTLGIRVVRDKFCSTLIKKMRRPLVSTSANLSGQPTPQSFDQISPQILKGVDYVVNLQRSKKSPKPSAIIKLSTDGQVRVIRK